MNACRLFRQPHSLLSVRDPTQQCCYDDGVKIFPGIYLRVVMKGDIDNVVIRNYP